MDDDLLVIFIQESREHLDLLEPSLIALEENRKDDNTINAIFRAVHSLKGASGFFGFEKIAKLSHHMENLMASIRNKKMSVNQPIIDALLAGTDKLRIMINDIDNQDNVQTQNEISAIQRIMGENPSDENNSEGSKDGSASGNDRPEWLRPFPNISAEVLQKVLNAGETLYTVQLGVKTDIHEREKMLSQYISELESLGKFLSSTTNADAITDLEHAFLGDLACDFLFSTLMQPDLVYLSFDVPADQIEEIKKEEIKKAIAFLDKDGTVAKQVINNTNTVSAKTDALGDIFADEQPEVIDSEHVFVEGGDPTEKATVAKTTFGKADDTIRVQVGLLGDLMNLAGEMVLARNQLLRIADKLVEHIPGLSSILQNINIVTSEMQEKVMLTRLQPISVLFNKFTRVIRSLSQKLKKEVKLKLSGEEVELDKSIIEALSDPLNHLIRNCIDHGLETPAEREKAGKSRTGNICLDAKHVGGQIHIEIIDDGKGIDVKQVKQKVIKLGLAKEDELEHMSKQDIIQHIFLPGFSTAQKVSDVSGRGVGMDVVKTNIETLNGSVEIDSEEGKGTRICLKLPLTLAIIPAMIVGVGNRKFAVPQVNLEEIVRLGDNYKIENIRGTIVLRLREMLLPLVNMAQLLGIQHKTFIPELINKSDDKKINSEANSGKSAGKSSENSSEKSSEKSGEKSAETAAETGLENWHDDDIAQHILVLKVDKKRYGLIVGELFDSEEIVVKPLCSYLKNTQCYAGATLMGDGKVAMILDADGITNLAKLQFSEIDKTNQAKEESAIRAAGFACEKQSLLLFRNGTDEHFAISLAMVARIERIQTTSIEKVGNEEYIKYGESSLRLLRLHNYLPTKSPAEETSEIYVIVPQLVKKPMGIVATKIEDVIEVPVALDQETVKGTGILGSAIIKENLNIFIDVYRIFEEADPECYKMTDKNEDEIKLLRKKRILLAEDTAFFQTIEMNYLKGLFDHIDVASDGQEAWNMICKNKYDLILSDIEMPRMNGFELVQKIKNSEDYKHIPVVALTSMSGKKDFEQGYHSGFDDYEVKLDKDKLFHSLKDILLSK